MLCEECSCQEAEIMVTAIVNGESITKHLCKNCAVKYQNGSLQGVLSSVLAALKKTNTTPVQSSRTCPACGMEFGSFLKSGKLGCPGCFDAFRSGLTDLLGKIQGKTTHTGTVPDADENGKNTCGEVLEMRIELQKAILQENYEAAALLRDRISDLCCVGAPKEPDHE